MKIIEVHWQDAFIDTGDMSIKKARTLKPIKRFTVGYLISENDDCLVLSTDYFPNKKKKVTEISATMVIPRSWISHWEFLEIKDD
jgi:hypothetical protein